MSIMDQIDEEKFEEVAKILEMTDKLNGVYEQLMEAKIKLNYEIDELADLILRQRDALDEKVDKIEIHKQEELDLD